MLLSKHLPADRKIDTFPPPHRAFLLIVRSSVERATGFLSQFLQTVQDALVAFPMGFSGEACATMLTDPVIQKLQYSEMLDDIKQVLQPDGKSQLNVSPPTGIAF